MAERTLPLPSHLFRWLAAPAAFTAFRIAMTLLHRWRARRLRVPRMSDEWLHDHATQPWRQ